MSTDSPEPLILFHMFICPSSPIVGLTESKMRRMWIINSHFWHLNVRSGLWIRACTLLLFNIWMPFCTTDIGSATSKLEVCSLFYLKSIYSVYSLDHCCLSLCVVLLVYRGSFKPSSPSSWLCLIRCNNWGCLCDFLFFSVFVSLIFIGDRDGGETSTLIH